MPLYKEMNIVPFLTVIHSKSFIEKCIFVVFGPGDQDSIPGQVIPKKQKMVLDATLLNTQHYKVRFKGKVKQSRERSSALTYTSV